MMMFEMFNGHDMVLYSARTIEPSDTTMDNGVPGSPTRITDNDDTTTGNALVAPAAAAPATGAAPVIAVLAPATATAAPAAAATAAPAAAAAAAPAAATLSAGAAPRQGRNSQSAAAEIRRNKRSKTALKLRDSSSSMLGDDTSIAAVAQAIANQTAAEHTERKRATDLQHARASIALLLQHRDMLSVAQNNGLSATMSTMLTGAIGVLGPAAPVVAPIDDSARPRKRQRRSSVGQSDASGVDEEVDATDGWESEDEENAGWMNQAAGSAAF
jgi:hypothetical protein